MKTVLFVILLILAAALLFIGTCRIAAGNLYRRKPAPEFLKEVRAKESYFALDRLDPLFIKLLVSAEDRRFYSHHGYDAIAIRMSILHDLRNLTQKSEWVGASTITQQLARNLYLNTQRNFTRKLKEFFLACMIERDLSKEEILDLYCNILYFGMNTYGIRDGAQMLIGKTPDVLTMNECVTLLAVIAGPNVVNPLDPRDPVNNRRRFFMWREIKLLALVFNKTITEAEAEAVRKEGWPLPELPEKPQTSA